MSGPNITIHEHGYNTGQGTNRSLQGHTEQAIGLIDIISEGPIAGLVHGGKSIFLDSDMLYDDSETGYSSVAGETVSRHPSVTNLLIINQYGDELFDYAPSTEDENPGKRYILIHNRFEMEDQAPASPAVAGENAITYNENSSADFSTSTYNNRVRTFNLVLDGDFSHISTNDRNNLVTNYSVGDIAQQNKLASGDGLVTVWSKDEDRKITGTISAFSATQITIQLQIGTLDNGYEWIKETTNGRSNLKLKFSQFLKISSISGNQITLAGAVGTAGMQNRTFSITKVIYNDASHSNPATNKIRSSGYQFVSGSKDQLLFKAYQEL